MAQKVFSTLFAGIIGLSGLSFIVIIHEFGHFLMCKLFDVSTPIFSIGFGPTLIGHQFGKTYFQIALLPLGGYVSIAQHELSALPYMPMVLIILAGIIVNFVFAFVILSALGRVRLAQYNQLLRSLLTETNMSGIIGPLGIITIIGTSVHYGGGFFIFILALLSLNLGFFNMLPIPFFDGGQLVWHTIERITGPASPEFTQILYFLFFIILLCTTIFIISRDLFRLRG